MKYPLTGRVSDEIDLSDERFFMLFEVHEIDHGSGTVHLKNLDVSHAGASDAAVKAAAAENESSSIVEKDKDVMIADSSWWYR